MGAPVLTTETIHGRRALVRLGSVGQELIVVLHAGNDSPEAAAESLPFHLLSPTATVAFLAGSPDVPWLRGWACGGGILWPATWLSGDDVPHVMACVDTISTWVKPARTLIAGHSNGGHLALRCAALRGIRPGFDVVTWGSVLTEIPLEPHWKDPGLRIRAYHGTRDQLVPPNGPIVIRGRNVPARAETATYFGSTLSTVFYTGGHNPPEDAAQGALKWWRG